MSAKRTTVDSVQLAEWVLAKIGPMNHLKLQKLVYYLDAYHLAYFDGEPLIEEHFEAWAHGPASRKVWNRFRDETNPLFNALSVPESKKRGVIQKLESQLTEDQLVLMLDVLKEYGNKPSCHLESLTHSETPWIHARKDTPPGARCTAKLSKVATGKFYRQYLR